MPNRYHCREIVLQPRLRQWIGANLYWAVVLGNLLSLEMSDFPADLDHLVV